MLVKLRASIGLMVSAVLLGTSYVTIDLAHGQTRSVVGNKECLQPGFCRTNPSEVRDFDSHFRVETCDRAQWLNSKGKEIAESTDQNYGSVYTCYNGVRPITTIRIGEKMYTLVEDIIRTEKLYGLVCKNSVAISFGSDSPNEKGHYFENLIFDKNMKSLRSFSSLWDYPYQNCDDLSKFLQR